MAASDHLFNKYDQKIRQVKSQIITHQVPEEKIKATRLLKLLPCFLKWLACCTCQAPNPERITVSL